MRLATPALRPSILLSRGHPQQVEGGTIDPMRTSETAWLDRFFGVNRGAPETDVTRAVVARAVAPHHTTVSVKDSPSPSLITQRTSTRSPWRRVCGWC